MITETDIK